MRGSAGGKKGIPEKGKELAGAGESKKTRKVNPERNMGARQDEKNPIALIFTKTDRPERKKKKDA